MVKAKKTKNIHLTNVKKKGMTLKKSLVEKIRSYVDKYDHIYLLNFNKQLSTNKLQELREEWKPNGRFTFGKNKVSVVALGKKPEDEYHDNLHVLSKDVKGDNCLLFTSSSKQDVLKFISQSKHGLELKSIWSKDGSYFNFNKNIEKMEA